MSGTGWRRFSLAGCSFASRGSRGQEKRRKCAVWWGENKDRRSHRARSPTRAQVGGIFFFFSTPKSSRRARDGSRGAHPRHTGAPLCAVEEPAASAHAFSVRNLAPRLWHWSRPFPYIQHSREAEALSQFMGRLRRRWKTGPRSEKSEGHTLLTSSLSTHTHICRARRGKWAVHISHRSNSSRLKEVGETQPPVGKSPKEERVLSFVQFGVYFWMCGALVLVLIFTFCLQE